MNPENTVVQPRILVVQAVVPHYRLPFFRLLQEAKDLRIEFAAAAAYAGFRSAPGLQMQPAPVRELAGGRLFWQTIDLSGLRRGDAVIFSGNARFLNLLPCILEARARGLRVGWWGHWKSEGAPKKSAALRRLLSRCADTHIMYSEPERAAALRWGLDPSRVFVAQNTIDDRRIRGLVCEYEKDPAAFAHDLPGPSGRPCFLSIGRLMARKKVDLAIRAIAAVQEPHRPVLYVVGDGPERNALEGLAAELGVQDRVFFLGEVTDDRQLLPLFRRCVANVSAGPIGLAAPHSLAFGLPVVCVDTHHAPESHFLVHERNALCCAQSVDALAAAMSRLLEDAPLLERLRSGARQSARDEVPIEKMVEGFLAACRQLVSGGSGSDVPRTLAAPRRLHADDAAADAGAATLRDPAGHAD